MSSSSWSAVFRTLPRSRPIRRRGIAGMGLDRRHDLVALTELSTGSVVSASDHGMRVGRGRRRPPGRRRRPCPRRRAGSGRAGGRVRHAAVGMLRHRAAPRSRLQGAGHRARPEQEPLFRASPEVEKWRSTSGSDSFGSIGHGGRHECLDVADRGLHVRLGPVEAHGGRRERPSPARPRRPRAGGASRHRPRRPPRRSGRARTSVTQTTCSAQPGKRERSSPPTWRREIILATWVLPAPSS